MDPIRRIASLGSQLSSSFANRAPHRDAAPFLYPICSPLFYAYRLLSTGARFCPLKRLKPLPQQGFQGLYLFQQP